MLGVAATMAIALFFVGKALLSAKEANGALEANNATLVGALQGAKVVRDTLQKNMDDMRMSFQAQIEDTATAVRDLHKLTLVKNEESDQVDAQLDWAEVIDDDERWVCHNLSYSAEFINSLRFTAANSDPGT